MSLGRVMLAWIGGEHAFNVAKLGERLELEEKCGAGTQEILARLMDGRGRFRDIRETIRIGLIGGGMAAAEADRLIRLHVDEAPRAENLALAKAILMAEILGVPADDDVGKPDADRTTTEAGSTETAASSDPLSSASALPSDSRRPRSTAAPSGSSPLPLPDGPRPTEASPSPNT